MGIVHGPSNSDFTNVLDNICVESKNVEQIEAEESGGCQGLGGWQKKWGDGKNV